MKEVLSLFTFGIGALCFVVFVTVFKRMPSAQSLGRASPTIATRKLRYAYPLRLCRSVRGCRRTAIVSAAPEGRSLPKQEAADRSAAPA